MFRSLLFIGAMFIAETLIVKCHTTASVSETMQFNIKDICRHKVRGDLWCCSWGPTCTLCSNLHGGHTQQGSCTLLTAREGRLDSALHGLTLVVCEQWWLHTVQTVMNQSLPFFFHFTSPLLLSTFPLIVRLLSAVVVPYHFVYHFR